MFGRRRFSSLNFKNLFGNRARHMKSLLIEGGRSINRVAVFQIRILIEAENENEYDKIIDRYQEKDNWPFGKDDNIKNFRVDLKEERDIKDLNELNITRGINKLFMYPPWDRTIEEIRKRDRYRCTNCGRTSRLEVHHILPKCEGGDDTHLNLVTLCHECHIKKQNELGTFSKYHPHK